jgi:hypothetical protein
MKGFVIVPKEKLHKKKINGRTFYYVDSDKDITLMVIKEDENDS